MAKTLAEILAGGSIQDSALDRQAALANSLLASGQRATNPLIAFLTGAVGNYQLADVAKQQRTKETELEAAAKAEAERAASQPKGLFEGTSMDAQVYNILATADPSSKAYQVAYNIASTPKITVDANGNKQIIEPNMSAFQQALLNNPKVPNETIPTQLPTQPPAPVTTPNVVTVPNLDQMPIDANEYDTSNWQTTPTVIDDLAPKITEVGGSRITEIPSETKKFANKMEAEKGLRSEFDDQTKGFKTVASAFKKIKEVADNPSPAGDISLITGYMKMQDPTSTVRESEFATAQFAASVPEQIKAYYTKVANGEMLTPTQRADFVKQAENMYKAEESNYNNTYDRYTGLAQSYNVDPKNVVSDYRVKGKAIKKYNPRTGKIE